MIQRSANPGQNKSFSLVDETALDTGDLILTTEEVEKYDYQVLRNLAAQANTDEVNGKSNKLLIQKVFGRQATLNDYE